MGIAVIVLFVLLFPSLSESSGFPTVDLSTLFNEVEAASFHLFQRVVGFRPLTVTSG